MKYIVGIRRAQVLETNEFKETGKIKVKVMGSTPDGLWEDAEVMTPYGGLSNMGMQAIPPIGAVGMVAYDRNDESAPIWLGSLIRTYDFTSNKETENGWLTGVESDSPTDFIIKTQYTKADALDIDTEDNKIESIFKMNEAEMTLAKVRQDSDYAYKKEAYDLEEEAYNLVKMTDEEIKIKFKFKDNSKDNTISIKEDSVSMSFDTESGEMSASIKEDTIELTAGGSVITIDKDGDVKIDTQGKIKLNGDAKTGVLYEALRDFVNSVYNSHTHGTPAGPSSPPMKPYTQSESMKSKSVKLT